jgi:hypothetical protein
MSFIREEPEFRKSLGAVIRFGSATAAFLALAVVVPLTLWYGWKRHDELAEPIVGSVFCAAFAWCSISLLRWQRYMRKLGWSEPDKMAFGLGPRPTDSDDLAIWKRGTSLRYSFAALVLSMLAFGVMKYLEGDY